MKLSKFVIATVVGTTFMTLYSYWVSKKEKQQFTEPVLLNELIGRSESLPEINDTKTHLAGWAGHYGIGLAFIIAYYILWRRSLQSPSVPKALVVGAASGLAGIVAWKLMFAASNNPPGNDRYKYYRQLFVAHIIFSFAALYGYKLPDYINRRHLVN